MKIDLVYLWVDGTDPKWIAKKNQYLPKDRQLDVEIAGDCRYIDHDELKYSLRSVERFAPWINHIYILTDGQQPKWMKLPSPKITIVDHSEIIPAEHLPLFNSAVIELYLHKIEGLSEHFLYANDDMLFGREVDPSFFFHADGEPIVRLAKQKIKGRSGNYQRTIYRMQIEAKKRYGKFFKLAPHHNIDAYRRSDFESTMNEFSDDLANSTQNRFRDDSDMQRAIVNYRLLAKSKRKAVQIGRYNGTTGMRDTILRFVIKRYISDSRCFPIHTKNLEKMVARYNPALFTINDEGKANDKQRAQAIKFLKRLLPEKSQFEL